MRKIKISMGKLLCLTTILLLTLNLFASTFVSSEIKTEFNKGFSEKTNKSSFSTVNDDNKSDLLFEEELLEEEEESESLDEKFHDFIDLNETFSCFRIIVLNHLSNKIKFNHIILAVNSVPKWLMIRHILI